MEFIEKIKEYIGTGNEHFTFSAKKKIKFSFDEKKSVFKIYIPIAIRLGENIPETAFTIQKKVDSILKENEINIKRKSIDVDVIEVYGLDV